LFKLQHDIREAEQKIDELSVRFEDHGTDANPPPSENPKESSPVSKCEIVFFAANPTGSAPLKLDEEAREIESKIRAAEHRDTLKLITKWATRRDDLLQSLNEHPLARVMHFSGHGDGDGIVLTNEQGEAKPVSKAALGKLLRTLGANIRLVVLNACHSKSQADAIIEHVDCAVGMNKAIGDKAAIVFAASMYRAIGFNKSVQDAYDQGVTALLLEDIPEQHTPELLVKDGVDASQVFLLNPK